MSTFHTGEQTHPAVLPQLQALEPTAGRAAFAWLQAMRAMRASVSDGYGYGYTVRDEKATD
ncbi:hypothetical protein ACFRAO_22965 [Streptomyces sp. NPDC056656]|uniref:hypothetical protein n=1 Tax=Streptomyces sp. NPDC056656 TaxID=3345895 RepID=UPI00367D66D8